MSSKNTPDASPLQREIMEQRHARRMQLREMYLKDVGHPTKSIFFDTGLFRYSASKTRFMHHFEPNVSHSLIRVLLIGTLIVTVAVFGKKNKDAQEHKLRTGQVSYADRWTRFL